jgi:hypothetical protein
MAAQVHLRGAIAIALLALAAPRTAPPIDLDVGVPPGSPTGWARSIPVVTPRLHPWRAVTQRLPKGGTVAGVPRRPVDRGLSGAGVLRIATPDVTGHLEWVNGLRPDGKVVTGGALASLPPVSAGLRWVGIAAFLRLLLHRQQVAGPEVVAHLVEIGEPAAWCAEAAAAEDALAEPAKDVLRRIDKGPRGSRPPVGACLREAMWLRFVGEELAAAHPFDPEGGFGSRLFLFAEEVEPLLVRWLQADADRFVVRNAAAALGRYHTTTAQAALAAAVATTRDEVVLMRALAALEPGCDADPLLKRLAGNNDDVEVAALVAALGRILATGAVPTLLDRMRNHPDPDLLLTTLVALNRIAQPGDRSGAADWAAAICSAAASGSAPVLRPPTSPTRLPCAARPSSSWRPACASGSAPPARTERSARC